MDELRVGGSSGPRIFQARAPGQRRKEQVREPQLTEKKQPMGE